MQSEGRYLGKMAFEIHQGDHDFILDATEDHGGEGRGPSPKGLLLSGLIGCTGMDVVSMLNKMRMPFDDLKIQAFCELTDEYPKVFKEITLTYAFEGNGLDLEKVQKAIAMSQDKYCGVSAMLRKNSEIKVEIYFNDKKVG